MSDQENSNSVEANKIKNNSRRSFLKKASIGAPVVIASSSKPAWGLATCMSGMMSGNASNHTPTCDLSGGQSHTYWRHHFIGAKSSPLKNKLSAAGKHSNKDTDDMGRYYYKSGRNVVLSSYKTESYISNIKFQNALVEYGNGLFEREIVTALINADMASKGAFAYPYSKADVESIYVEVAASNGTLDPVEIGRMLEGIHSR